MTIGEKIKALRLENNVTQEKLAEYLNITYQSVSKWENNNALPDISLVVPLANFFGVSIDELFDRHGDIETAEIEEYCKKDQEFANKGYITEQISLWREAVQKYPRNYRCLIKLANSLTLTLLTTGFEEVREGNAKEAVTICQRILNDCTDSDIRNKAISLLVYTYSNENLSLADETEAVKYASMASKFWLCSDLLLEYAYYTEEGKKKALSKKHFNNLFYIDSLCDNLYLSSDENRTPEEKIFACETALKLWTTLIYDDNFLFYHCRLASIHQKLAAIYAKLGNVDRTIYNLEKALHHGEKFDTQPAGEQHFTSVFVSEATNDSSKTRKNYTQTHTQLIKEAMQNSCYDFVRKDERFVELLK